MEVETRPPLVDGKLGLHAHSTSPDLRLAIDESDIYSDEERELLRSPVEERITCVKDTLFNGSALQNELERDIPIVVSNDIAKCNGDIASELVSDAANVFRTENRSSVCARRPDDADSKSHAGEDKDASNEQNCSAISLSNEEGDLSRESNTKGYDFSQKLSRKSSSSDEHCEDVSGTDLIVEDPCSLDASELHIAGELNLLEASSNNDNLEVSNDPVTVAEESSSFESNVDNESPNERKEEDAEEGLSEQLLDSGLSPKPLVDCSDELDEIAIPQVIDITSICVNKKNDDESIPVEATKNNTNQFDGDETAALGDKNREAISLEDEAKTVVSSVGDEIAESGEDRETAAVDEFDTEPVDGTTGVNQRDGEDANDGDAIAEVETVDGALRDESLEGISNEEGHEELLVVADEGVTSIAEIEPADSALRVESLEAVSYEEDHEELLVGADDGVASDTGVNDEQDPAPSTPGVDECTEAEFPAEETTVDESMDLEQEEDGSPGYQGMTDDILPIIESELDDIPMGEDNIFDTEVECDDGGMTSVLDGENTQDEACPSPPADDDLGSVASHPILESSQTEDEEREESSALLAFEKKFPLLDRTRLKRRASADTTPESPPLKILKRQVSLDNLDECSGKFDKAKSLDEFKKMSEKKLPPAPASITSEPLDIPVEIEEVELVPTPAKRRKTTVDEIAAPVAPSPSTASPTKSDDGQQKEQSVLVIDLDDEDDKPDTSSSDVESQVREQVEPSENARRSALDVLFNGKKEITLNRKMFTRIMKSYVSQYLLTFSDLGKATRLSLKANDVMTKIQSSVSNYEKQKEDFKCIMNKLIEDRQARKTWDETVVPPKATRTVGLQVCSVGTMFVKNDSEELPSSVTNKTPPKAKVPNSSANQSQALAQQKQAFAQQQMAMAQSRAKTVEQNINVRPIAKKSVTPTNRPMVIRTVPATKPLTPIKPKLVIPQTPVTTTKLNGLKAVTVTRNPEAAPNQNASPLTVTTVSPNSRTFTLSNKGTFAVKSPQKPTINTQIKQPNALLSKALITGGVAARGAAVTIATKRPPQNASTAVPVAVAHTPGSVQNSKNLTSGPGRPGKTPAPAKTVASSVPDTTIDLTDMDDDAPQPVKTSVTPSNTTARKSTTASRVNAPNKVPSASSKPMRHPPLPPNPQNFNPSTAPPKPYLGICDTQTVTQGIMLTWHFNQVIPLRKISKFQVFAYQETKGDAEDSWKKVGDVDALPLPMACTLTQFREGYTYHFIVRALDDAGHVGPFSAPNTITLMKKTV